tara:strand:- start:2141 stop:3301 length:1161 start_codon:yes stop_codon:yes gene_type:complete
MTDRKYTATRSVSTSKTNTKIALGITALLIAGGLAFVAIPKQTAFTCTGIISPGYSRCPGFGENISGNTRIQHSTACSQTKKAEHCTVAKQCNTLQTPDETEGFVRCSTENLALAGAVQTQDAPFLYYAQCPEPSSDLLCALTCPEGSVVKSSTFSTISGGLHTETYCEPCLGNTVPNAEKTTCVETCPTGQTPTPSEIACQCAPNFIFSQNHNACEIVCKENEIANEDKNRCDCISGYVFNEKRNQCVVQCKKGEEADSSGNSCIISCPTNYTPNEDNTACAISCPEGASPNTRGTACTCTDPGYRIKEHNDGTFYCKQIMCLGTALRDNNGIKCPGSEKAPASGWAEEEWHLIRTCTDAPCEFFCGGDKVPQLNKKTKAWECVK